jgi:hypothetical protein
MGKAAKVASTSAIVALTLIIAFGVLGLLVVIPATAADLVQTFSDYSGDQNLIQVLLSIPTFIAITIFCEIIFLLVLLGQNKMLTYSTFKWVRLLGYSAFTLAASFGSLIGYLEYKNTLPPGVAIVIIVLILFSLAVSLVTFSLLGLLRTATEAKLDLEGVI